MKTMWSLLALTFVVALPFCVSANAEEKERDAVWDDRVVSSAVEDVETESKSAESDLEQQEPVEDID